MKKIFNFSPGPAVLPHKVLLKAQNELINWNNLNFSVMEISHRSKYFINLVEEFENDLRILMNIPNTYKILFFQGGARTQFAAIPMNLLNYNQKADYANIGYWSYKAMEEAKKYCKPNIIHTRKIINNILYIKPMNEWLLDNKSIYIHYCSNETIEGIAINEDPKFKDAIVVADLSSTILTKKINITNYGIIYASTQKNVGPSGLTIVIIRDDLIIKNNYRKELPSVLNYKIISDNNSMYNTPPTFSLYLSSLVVKWLKKKGGVKYINKINQKKAKLLYSTIDNSKIYVNNISVKNRSITNIVFKINKKNIENKFLKEAEKQGLYFLKGHSIIGGIRASIYNAMPIEGVQALVKFMNNFEKLYI
ncbi:3-phosphoserine/phosphohydroxythreonine transaminase [Enterobacteriaceae endosymbiont of Plateumaris consimilis]|uniref:3-phosphoserine/phosphohydroxythreonine transaminase n=1 Tax=Enterobacteriaceae endosymbiont of Plateumaris consimilis TaxID=2675794 RepID=UPI001449B409|nr:3-phosphoserine/phosphohydroxythreonine transaminase [Enterobacteriaceae endosymbiont of Plateumaris consimilis]QJC28700.1 3-phosphoserine/phosphohydroxythreonine transaminase [Enterobacteriaceae endosymbiont of Plateumaris consimilis]